MTLQSKLAGSLLSLGYKPVHQNSNGKYQKFSPPTDRTGLFREPHFILLGKAGACRVTRSGIANSTPVSEKLYQKLLEAGEKLEGKVGYLEANSGL